jgi:subtilisin family serine protease
VTSIPQDILYKYTIRGSTIPPKEPNNWGLDRIDEKYLPMNNRFRTNYTGYGVYIYTFDSGIDLNHPEFAGSRAICGFDGIQDTPIPCDDTYGHGTMMSGIAGGNDSGVAKKARLVSVKIGDENGPTFAALLGGIEYVIQEKMSSPTRPMVATFAFDGIVEQTFDDAIIRLHDAGVFVTVAAGNSGIDACSTSPPYIPQLFTVGATGPSDKVMPFSNFGACVDIFAPGSKIYEPSIFQESSYYREGDGTSEATAFVGGVSALHLQRNPKLTPSSLAAIMKEDATKGILYSPIRNMTSTWFQTTSTSNLLLNIGTLNPLVLLGHKA